MAIKIECYNGYFGQVYTSGEDADFVKRGQDFDMDEIALDEDNGEIYYTVEGKKLGETMKFTISKKDALDKKKVLEYVCQGLDVTGSNAAIVPEVFAIKEEEYVEAQKPISKVHSIAGVKKILASDGKESYIYAGVTNPITGSKYIGHLNLQPIGDKESWFLFVKKEMKNSIEISFIISLAMSAILHSILRNKIDVDNFVVHIRGDSSSGKTTMLCLASSVFGPGTEKDPNGIISTWNATKNALLRRLMNVNGILMGLDEVSMNREKDFTGLLYSICSGIEKDRLTRDAQVQERLTGHYILLSTGEASLLAKTNGNIGLSLRVLEFDNHQWTSSAEQAERIKRFCKNNYGHAATEFGLKLYQFILDNGIDRVCDDFEYWRAFYCKRCSIQARKERMSGRYALILLAAQYANRFFDMDIDIPKLCNFIIENENSNEDDRDSYGNFYNRFVAYVIMNIEHFDDERSKTAVDCYGGIPEVRKELQKYKAREPWGEFNYLTQGYKLPTGDVSYKTVSITEVAFDKIVTKELGYEDPKALRKFLKGKGLAICEKDRDTKRKMFRGTRTNMVTIYLPTDEHLSAEEQKTLAKHKIKDRFHQLDDMATLGVIKRNQAFRELEKLKCYMTKSEEKHYQSLLQDKEMLIKTKLLLDEDE